MPAVKTITLDPDGDLILLIDTKGDSQDSATTGEGSAIPTSETSDKKSELANKVHLIVSSKHMCLASPVFKAMLGPGFKEGDQLREKGRIEVPLPDDDAAALEIVARIIHGRFTTVPAFVSLPLFTQISILVDKYRMPEIVHLNASAWSTALNFALNLGECSHISWPDRLRWLCISYVLRRYVEFKAITQSICRESDRSVAKLVEESELTYLPIPQSVLDAIETMRQQSIQNAIALLYALILKYQSSKNSLCPLRNVPNQLEHTSTPKSSFGSLNQPRYTSTPVPGYGAISVHRNECDAMVLGYLIKSAYAQNLYPQPLPPYDSYSFSSVYYGLNRLDITTACAKLSGKPEDNHGILGTLQKDLKMMWNSIKGLDLGDFRLYSISVPSHTVA